MNPEFSHIHKLDTLPPAGKMVKIEADEAERAALAKRFGLMRLDSLTAQYKLTRLASGVEAEGELAASGAQVCVVTAGEAPFTLTEPFRLLFTTDGHQSDEVDLEDGDLDSLPIEGGGIDMGEAVAQSLALALDPYPRSPEADAVREKLGISSEDDVVTGPFAALAALKKNHD